MASSEETLTCPNCGLRLKSGQKSHYWPGGGGWACTRWDRSDGEEVEMPDNRSEGDDGGETDLMREAS